MYLFVATPQQHLKSRTLEANPPMMVTYNIYMFGGNVNLHSGGTRLTRSAGSSVNTLNVNGNNVNVNVGNNNTINTTGADSSDEDSVFSDGCDSTAQCHTL